MYLHPHLYVYLIGFFIPVANPIPPNITGGIAMSKQPTEPAIDKTCAPRGVRAARTRWKYACQIKLEKISNKSNLQK